MDAVITFRANARLIAEAEALAAFEDISRSDVAGASCSETLTLKAPDWRADAWRIAPVGLLAAASETSVLLM